MTKKKVLCIGAAAVDVQGRSHQKLLLGSTVPGVTGVGIGGIARNMAENFARLSCEAYLLSVVGTDIFGEYVLNETNRVGVHTEFVERCIEYTTALRVAILNKEGEMQYGIFGNAIIKQLSPAYLKRFSCLLRSADLIVAQTNLPIESLKFLANLAQENAIPFHINATSVPLASHLLAVINMAPSIGANQKEAETLMGRPIMTPAEAIQVGESLLGAGAKQVIITLGPRGAVYCKRDFACHCEAFPVQIADTTGAGDALCSGLLFCLLNSQPAEYSLEYGLAAAALTVESTYAVSPLLSPESIHRRLTQNRQSRTV